MKDINIIPIEENQPSIAQDLYKQAESSGLIDALKIFASIEYKKDRKIKIVKFTDGDGEPSWRVNLLNAFGDILWSAEFLNYDEAQHYKKSVEDWAKTGCKLFKDQPYKFVVWENWTTATSGHVSQIHIASDLGKTLCNKKIPYVGEKFKPNYMPPGSLHAVKLADIPNSGWDLWWHRNKGINERTQAVSFHDKLRDFDYSNELGTNLEFRHLEKCGCCFNRRKHLRGLQLIKSNATR